jgi:hypothetical protein
MRNSIIHFHDILEIAIDPVFPQHRISESGSLSEVLWFETTRKMDSVQNIRQ